MRAGVCKGSAEGTAERRWAVGPIHEKDDLKDELVLPKVIAVLVDHSIHLHAAANVCRPSLEVLLSRHRRA